MGCLDVSCPEESNVQTGDNDVFVVSEDCKNKLTTKMPSSDSCRKSSVPDNMDHKDDLVDMDNQQKTLGTETPVKIFTTTETGNCAKTVNGLEDPASDPNNLDLEAADLDLAQRLSRSGIRLSTPSPCMMINNADKTGAYRYAHQQNVYLHNSFSYPYILEFWQFLLLFKNNPRRKDLVFSKLLKNGIAYSSHFVLKIECSC